MARSIRLAKAEREFLRSILTPSSMDWSALGPKGPKVAAAILAKVEESEEKAPGVEVGPIEAALIAAARGKVLPLEGGFGRASVVAASVGATVETATMVGAWMARQGWLTQPQTLLDVLNKWPQWVPKARATQSPPALEPGLGDTRIPASVVPEEPRPSPGKGRSVPGFR